MNKNIFLFLAIILLPYSLFSQMRSLKYGMEYKIGADLIFHDGKSNLYLKNAVGPSLNLSVFYRNVFINSRTRFYNTTVKRSLILIPAIVPKEQKIELDFRSFMVGYKFFILRREYSVDPYAGIILSNVFDEEYNPLISTRIGKVIGITANKYIITRSKYPHFLISVDSNVNFTNLYKANNKLGRRFYSIGIGFSVIIGKPESNFRR